MSKNAAALLIAAALTLSVSACGRGEPPRPRNVIFILVDTLRADRLGTYGYGRSTSPNVDAFARESVKFENARSQASCTYPSANSMLTSRWPSTFLGQPKQDLGIPQGIPSIAEILQSRGFRTVAVSASAVVRRNPSQFNPKGGFGRGFEVFQEDCEWRSANCVNRQARDLLVPGDRPLFAYLHFIDPHGPYQPPKAWPRRFAARAAAKRWVRFGDPNPIGDWLYKRKEHPGFTPDDLRHLSNLYDEEVAFFDARFAELMTHLRTSGLLEDSIVVFSSDHGEEFLEHGHVKHCRTLFDSSIRVPLFLRIPGVEARTVAAPVQNLDLVPTLLDYLGVDAAGYGFEGRSLKPLLQETAPPPESSLQFGLQGSLRSASDGRHKLIQDLARGTFSLFDLAADPKETRDVLRAERRAFFNLRDRLRGWLAASEGREGLRKSQEAEERLRSLGYIQ